MWVIQARLAFRLCSMSISFVRALIGCLESATTIDLGDSQMQRSAASDARNKESGKSVLQDCVVLKMSYRLEHSNHRRDNWPQD